MFYERNGAGRRFFRRVAADFFLRMTFVVCGEGTAVGALPLSLVNGSQITAIRSNSGAGQLGIKF